MLGFQRFYAASALVLLALTIFGCHTRDADEGSIHSTLQEVAGVYGDELDHGQERLALSSDGTFVQEFASRSFSFRQSGRWQLQNSFIDGSAVVLTEAAVPEMEWVGGAVQPVYRNPVRHGETMLYVHRRRGSLALARNEVADWYYERQR